jgi:hypothetical protein
MPLPGPCCARMANMEKKAHNKKTSFCIQQYNDLLEMITR